MEFLFQSLIKDEIFQYFLIVFIIIALTVWILTLITDNHSWMDKLWPLLPIFYSFGFLYVALYIRPVDEQSLSRLKLMTFLITIWGLRLAYVFYRRGYYKLNFEDHRWVMVKKRFNYPQKKFAFHIFNFFFMAIMQNMILFGYALPIWFIIQTKSKEPLNIADYIVTSLYAFFYLIEAVADEQQWNFQTKKYDWLDEKKSGTIKKSKYNEVEIEDFKRGFLCKGLFKYSRHPNYFGDIFLWWCIYLYTLSAQYSNLQQNFSVFSLFNYSMFSALLMSYLFQRSVAVTEKVSAKKYTEYSVYQSKVGRILPSIRAYTPTKTN